MSLNLKKKAYLVGSYKGINLPYWDDDCDSETILVEPNETKSKAKSKYLKNTYSSVEWNDLRARRQPENDLYWSERFERNESLSTIKYYERLDEWRLKMKKLVNENKGKSVYIWSGQWGAYWRTNCCGYTEKKSEAGIYEISEAWNNTSHCGLEKGIHFEFV